MKKISIILLTILFLFGCKKNETLLSNESNQQGKSLSYWNPLPPQITITNPVATWVVASNGCAGWDWPKVSPDTIQLKYSVTAGRIWSGTPDKLSKIRIVVDNVIVKEFTVAGQSYGETYIVNLPINGIVVPFDPTKEWHSIGISAWQRDGTVSSNCLYVWTNL